MYTAKSMCSGARPKGGVAGTELGVKWGAFVCVCGCVCGRKTQGVKGEENQRGVRKRL